MGRSHKMTRFRREAITEAVRRDDKPRCLPHGSANDRPALDAWFLRPPELIPATDAAAPRVPLIEALDGDGGCASMTESMDVESLSTRTTAIDRDTFASPRWAPRRHLRCPRAARGQFHLGCPSIDEERSRQLRRMHTVSGPGLSRASATCTVVVLLFLAPLVGAQSPHEVASRSDVAVAEALRALLPEAVGSLTPLHVGSALGGVTFIAASLAAGADPNVRNRHGFAPLHAAAVFGQVAAIEVLLAAGANPHATAHNGQTPLHRAALARKLQDMVDGLVSLRARHPAEPDASGPMDGPPPLRYPAFAGSAAIEALLGAGANPDARDVHGASAVHHGAHGGDAAALEALLAAGADPNARDEDGRTPLHEAANEGELAAVEALLAAGADPNVQDKLALTPSIIATVLGHAEIAEALRSPRR